MSRILIVDDDAPLRTMLHRMLVALGHQCEEAANGLAALSVYDPATTDLVITDIVMPQMEGLELIQKLRLRNPEIKIIAMSGGGHKGGGDYLKMSQFLGADTTLAKPFSKDELQATVTMLLRSSQ